MIGPAGVWLSLAALILPGLIAWALARRHGIAVLWAALIAGALLGIAGWLVTRQPDPARNLAIYLVILPAFVSLVTGAAIGTLTGRR